MVCVGTYVNAKSQDLIHEYIYAMTMGNKIACQCCRRAAAADRGAKVWAAGLCGGLPCAPDAAHPRSPGGGGARCIRLP